MTKNIEPEINEPEISEPTKGYIRVNVHKWKFKDWQKFTKAAVKNDVDAMVDMLNEITVFPEGIEGVGDLEIEQWVLLIEEANELLTKRFQPSKARS